MAQRDRKDIMSSLARKGFQRSSGDHYFLILYVRGQKTSISTKISHSPQYKAYGDPLLAQMARRLKLSKQDLLQLIDCPIDREQYVQKLIEEGHIAPF